MDVGTATLVGVVVGAVLAWVISLFQRQADRHARSVERKYERLHSASRLLRLSVIQAAQLNYSRSVRGFLDLLAWPALRWDALARTISDAGAALSLVVDELPQDLGSEYETAAQEILDASHADRRRLDRYTKAALALNQAVVVRARSLR